MKAFPETTTHTICWHNDTQMKPTAQSEVLKKNSENSHSFKIVWNFVHLSSRFSRFESKLKSFLTGSGSFTWAKWAQKTFSFRFVHVYIFYDVENDVFIALWRCAIILENTGRGSFGCLMIKIFGPLNKMLIKITRIAK